MKNKKHNRKYQAWIDRETEDYIKKLQKEVKLSNGKFLIWLTTIKVKGMKDIIKEKIKEHSTQLVYWQERLKIIEDGEQNIIKTKNKGFDEVLYDE